jgi:antitoxin (DNA-binding transcriptional repressor) of toxin-antitoxin stability system
MFRNGLMTRACATAAGRRLAWRGHLIVLALMCLLGQTSTLVHRTLVQHATCVEHGESVHVPTRDRPVAHLTAAPEQAGLTAGIADEADQHDHCAAVDSRASAPRLAPDRALEAVVSRTFALVCTEAGLRPTVAAYLIAPKTSPPHAAS